MAEQDRDEKTEDVTPQRLEQMRKEGQIPLGREISAAFSLAGAVLLLWMIGGSLGESLITLARECARGIASPQEQLANELLSRAALIVVQIGGVVLAAALGGAAILLTQTQLLFNLELLAFKPERLLQFSRLVRSLGKEGAIDMLLALVKAMTVGSAIALVMSNLFEQLNLMAHSSPNLLLSGFLAPLQGGMPAILVALLITGGLDLFIQRRRFFEQAKMTKDEVKREMKESEGDPTNRSRRKKKHRELAKGRMREEVPLADVVVVNPTHIAVALRYRRGKDKAPKVVAKGKDLVADTIRELAKEHGVPIYRDVPLARLLHKRVKVGAEVPAETYKAVAAVLAFAYRLRRGPRDGARAKGATT